MFFAPAVLPSSPAEQAGLQAGDVIVSVNGKYLSSVAPENQISLLRGNSGSSVNLTVSRGGENITLYAKRATLSVQNLESKDVSAWRGRSQNISVEELNYLASQKIGDGYELLGVMQEGFLVTSDMENQNPQLMRHISLKKETGKENAFNASNVPKANAFNSANRSTISFSLANEANFSRITVLNIKGATVWQKNLGKLPAGASNVDWNGANLPAGSYRIKLETGSAVSVHKFDLR